MNTVGELSKEVLLIDNPSQLTEQHLVDCLLGGHDFVLLEMSPNEYEINKQTIRDFFTCKDHGFAHSLAVWKRCLAIIEASPNLWHLASNGKNALLSLMWACVFHDFSRFIENVDFQLHEAISAALVQDIIPNYPGISLMRRFIAYHDYFCPLIDGRPMPTEIMIPIGEIFRLADKTSNSPAEEIQRYYETGKRHGTPFFNYALPEKIRFDFVKNHAHRDMLTWFLILFAIQPSDFLYRETSQCYAIWAEGKREAFFKIGDLCRQEGLEPQRKKILGLIRHFCCKHHIKPTF